MANYEKAQKAKHELIDLLEQLSENEENAKQIVELDKIISKLEAWQNKHDKN